MNVRDIVVSHIGACEPEDWRNWCATHEALIGKGVDTECIVMTDALDLADAVLNAYPTRGKEYGLRVNCVKNGCQDTYGWLHLEHGEVKTISESSVHWKARWNTGHVNGHVCDHVAREVLYGVWEEVPE